MTDTTIPVTIVVDAVRALSRASRHTEAVALATAAAASETDPALALTRAETALMADYYRLRDIDAEPLRTAATTVTEHGDAADTWQLDLLRAKAAYFARLIPVMRRTDPPPETDPEADARLRRQAEAVRDSAPDDRRRAHAQLLLGWIHDNVLDDRDNAPAHYAAALRAGEEHAEDYLVFEALRHLGDHDHDAGDHEATRQRWERSAFHAARAGLVGPTLLQLLLVAVSLRDRGDEAGARAVASEAGRWGEAIGFERLRAMAAGFLAGADPTAEPTAEPEPSR